MVSCFCLLLHENTSFQATSDIICLRFQTDYNSFPIPCSLLISFLILHSGFFPNYVLAAHMPEFHSGIVAALLENPYKVLSSCKHDCELSMTSLIAVRAKSPLQGIYSAKGVNKLINAVPPLFNYLVIILITP